MQSESKPRASRGTALRDAIEQDIVTGLFASGDRLDEVTLAQRYNVSRTPIREALMQLASSGLVEIRPHRGSFVVDLSPSELVEMFEVMAELEGMCGRLAARRITPDRQAALLRANAACQEAEQQGDADAYYYANEVFHHEIYASSRNAFLEQQARALHKRLKPYRRLQLRAPGRIGSSRKEHQDIVDAISMGDAAAAETALRAHVLIQGSRFSDFIAALQDRPRAGSPDRDKPAARRLAGRATA